MKGAISVALDPRFKTAVLADGGCNTEKVLPEDDPLNFVPQIKIPVLMVNGRYDFVVPLETCQQPFFRLREPRLPTSIRSCLTLAMVYRSPRLSKKYWIGSIAISAV